VLRPDCVVSAADLAAGQRPPVMDLAWANATGVFSGGVILVAFALALGASPVRIGPLATACLAAIGLVSAVCGGIAPVVAGRLAQAVQASGLSAVVRRASRTRSGEFEVANFAHWAFLFALSAMLGLHAMHAMHALSRGRDGAEVGERRVIQAFGLEAWRSLNALSSVGGALGSVCPFERLPERRKWWRDRPPGT
jgi:hypothetical protein